jgi:hypothetical protein
MKTKDKIQLAFDTIKHIKKVETNCYVLAKAIAESTPDLALELIKRGRTHDSSKLNEYELINLNLPNNSEDFRSALKIHHQNNRHHPEHFEYMRKYHGKNFRAINYMSTTDVAEMVCDWVARGQEFGTGVREWVENEATKKYEFTMDEEIGKTINKYLDILLTPKFETNKNNIQ